MFGLDDIVGGVMKAVGVVLDRVIPDANARAAAKEEIERTVVAEAAKALSDQRDINKVEAASPSMFVAGWRPAVGWLCVFGLAWQYFVSPMLTWFLSVGQIIVGAPVLLPPFPLLGDATLEALLYSLLGIGGLRTVEKVTKSDTKGIVGMIAGAVTGRR